MGSGTAPTPRVEIRVLGGLDVEVEGLTRPIADAAARQLVALLAERAGTWVPTPLLADDLAPGVDEEIAAAGLAATVAAVRDALGPGAGALTFEDDRCRLDAAVVDLDPGPTTDSVVDADPDRWRGRPLANVPSSPRISAWRERLDEQFVRVHLDAGRRHLDAGRPDRALVLADRLLTAMPTLESAAAVAVEALIELGRHDEAIGRLTDVRRRTSGQGGAGTPILDRLEHDLLLDLVPWGGDPAERAMPAGRADAVRALLVDTGGAISLEGEPGIGRTTVLRAVADAIGRDGRAAVSVEVRAQPGRPFEVIADLVRGLLGRAGRPEHDARADAVRWLLDDTPPPSHDRVALVESAARWIIDDAERDRCCLVVDDAERLDASSAAVLDEIARSARVPLRLAVCTVPPTEIEVTITGRIRLGPLPPHALVPLLTDHGPGLGELHRRSGGNPTVATLLAAPDLDLVAIDASPPASDAAPTASASSSLPTLLERMLTDLPSSAVLVGAVAALSAPDFVVDHVLEVAGVERGEFERLAATGVVALDGDRGWFPRPALGEALLVGRSGAWIAETQHALAEGARRHRLGAEVVARHAVGARQIDPAGAVVALLDAGSEASRRFEESVAAGAFDQAITLLDPHGPSLHLVDAVLGRGRVARRAGDGEHVALLLRAAEMAHAIDAPGRLVNALVELCDHSAITRMGSVDPAVAPLLVAAMDAEVPPADRARLAAAAAVVLTFDPAVDGLRLYARALDLVSTAGDEVAERDVLLQLHLGLPDPADLGRRAQFVDRLREIGRDPDACWEVAFLDVMHGAIRGDGPTVRSSLAVVIELTDDELRRPRAFGREATIAAEAMIRGALDGAEEALDRALAFGRGTNSAAWAGAAHALGQMLVIDQRGHLPVLVPTLDALVAEMPEIPSWRAPLAAALAADGQWSAAQALLDAMITTVPDLPRDAVWQLTIVYWARTAVELGDVDAATRLLPLLTPFRDQLGWAVLFPMDPIGVAVAELCRTTGDELGARRAWHAAEALADGLGSDHLRRRISLSRLRSRA